MQEADNQRRRSAWFWLFVLPRMRSALEMVSETAHSRAGQGLLPISLSFRAARIVAANRIACFR